MILENVVAGNIQAVSMQELTSTGEVSVRVLHAATEDSGYGGHSRRRGWTGFCFLFIVWNLVGTDIVFSTQL